MTHPPSQAATTIPADDPTRSFTLAQSDNLNLPHVGLVGDTYTILVAGKDTAGRYSLIDMHIPPRGGPPPHRHDFEEMFSVLEGEIEFTFRGKKIVVRAGETQHPSERTSPIPKQDRAIGPTAVPMLAGRAGRVFQGSRRSRRDANNTATPTRRGGRGGIRCKGQSSCAEIPNRAFTPLKEEGPEHRTKGPTRRAVIKAHVRLGSQTEVGQTEPRVGLAPKSGLKADIAARQLRATSGLMRCGKNLLMMFQRRFVWARLAATASFEASTILG